MWPLGAAYGGGGFGRPNSGELARRRQGQGGGGAWGGRGIPAGGLGRAWKRSE
jgi:hypothetical protein